MDEIKKLILKFFAIEFILMLIANTVFVFSQKGIFGVGFLIIHTPIVLQYLLMRASLFIPGCINSHITIIKVILLLNIDIPLQVLYIGSCILFWFKLEDAYDIYQYYSLAVSIVLKIILFKQLNKLKEPL